MDWKNPRAHVEVAPNFSDMFIAFPFKIVIFATMYIYRSVFCTCCNNVLPLPSWVDFHTFHPQRPTLQPRLTVYRRLDSSGWWWWRADWGVWGGRCVGGSCLVEDSEPSCCWFFLRWECIVEIELYWIISEICRTLGPKHRWDVLKCYENFVYFPTPKNGYRRISAKSTTYFHGVKSFGVQSWPGIVIRQNPCDWTG